jgi:WD40 repeat protein
VPSGNICWADLLGGDFKFNGVFRFNDAGSPIAGGIPSGSAGLQGTAGIAIGPDGNIYVSSKDSGEVLFYNGNTGAPLPSPLPGGRDGLFAVLRDGTPEHEGSGPGPLRFGADGNLYVADYGGSTVRVYNGMTGSELPIAAHGLTPAGGLAFAPDGDLYVGNFGSGSIIRVRNGVQSPFIVSGTGPITTPSSMLFLPDGDVLVNSMFANEIHRYSATGEYRGLFAAIEPLTPPVGFTNFPSDLSFDADGNVLVAVLGATNPPDNRGQILRYKINEGSIEGTLLSNLVDAYPPIGSIAWIRSPNAIAGDFNGDAVINNNDYAKWRADFGKFVATGGGADGNGDGHVNAADYVAWRNATGGGTVTSLAAAIPEPGIAGLLSVAALIFMKRSNQRSRPF